MYSLLSKNLRFHRNNIKFLNTSNTIKTMSSLTGKDISRQTSTTAESESNGMVKSVKEEHFPHLRKGAQFNHGSFGSCPQSVLKVQNEWRDQWLHDGNSYFLDKKLANGLQEAVESTVPLLTDGTSNITSDQCVLVDNAATACALVAHHWSKEMQAYHQKVMQGFIKAIWHEEDATVNRDYKRGDVPIEDVAINIFPRPLLFYHDSLYGGCHHALNEYLKPDRLLRNGGQEGQGASFNSLGLLQDDDGNKKFPTTKKVVIERFERDTEKRLQEILKQFDDFLVEDSYEVSGSAIEVPIFLWIDHVNSQPAFVWPLAEMLPLFRSKVKEHFEGKLWKVCGVTFKFNTQPEIAIDGAHSVGSIQNFDVVRDCGDPDLFATNLHKWGYAPNTVNLMYVKSPELMQKMSHVVPCWFHKQGLQKESQWVGTRDYSSILAVPAAVKFLQEWRHPETNETSEEYNHRRVVETARYLAKAWGTEEFLVEPNDESALVASQYMVKLPFVPKHDVPGLPPPAGKLALRNVLRDEYNIEAALGTWPEIGCYLRLSYAIYNTQEEVEQLADAVLQEAKNKEKYI